MPVLDRFGRILAALVIVSLGAIWLIFAGIAYESYQGEWRQASATANNIAALLERDIGRNVEIFDLSLRAVVNGMADPKVMALPSDLQRGILFDHSATASGLGSILVLDRSGQSIMDSRAAGAAPMDFADRDYFQVHRDAPTDRGLFISRPFLSRKAGQWSIGLSRRIVDPEGRFAGVVSGGMQLSYILALYDQVKLPPDSSITLFDQAGNIIVRTPFDPADIGHRAAAVEDLKRAASGSGEFVGASGPDGVRRLLVSRPIANLTLVQAVGLSTNRFLSAWLTRVAMLAAAFLVLSALLIVLGGTLWHELQRRSRAERALSDLATTDGLTGLTNRRHFNHLLAAEWRRCARSNDTLSLLMIDCDFFKAFNDSLGHLRGDAALQAIAEAIRGSALRPADVSARYGGEEFVVLLPATDANGALVVAETIRTRVLALAMAHPASPSGVVTVSLGAASLRPRSTGEASVLVGAADTALYQAKAQGRNRVAAAPPPAEREPEPALAPS